MWQLWPFPSPVYFTELAKTFLGVCHGFLIYKVRELRDVSVWEALGQDN